MSIHDLADYPWDAVAPYAERARAYPGGLVNLSVGSPVDETPAVIAQALRDATDAHGYPATTGTAQLRTAIADWFHRRRRANAVVAEGAFPTVGSKELVALLPTLLGLGAGDVVVHPRAAYPTYEVGARLAGATPVAADDPSEWPAATRLVWLNSPGNPDGRVLTIDELRAVVKRARELGAVVASDECYAELGWEGEAATHVPSLLDDRVIDGDLRDLLAVYSLSKQSNLAGYRAAFVAGDPQLVGRLITARKHLGLLVPAPVQTAMTVALGDDGHVAEQKERYRRRREVLLPAVRAAGFRVDSSEAGLYLWATEDKDAWESMAGLADIGILAGPGHFYGPYFPRHVRFALTASDADIETAARRLRAR